jgi:surface carbohydrate biosynthesis protein
MVVAQFGNRELFSTGDMNMPRVLLFNDNSKRDLLGIRLLENALRACGLQTAICNPQNARIKLRQFRPHAFIAARGDHAVAREASALCRVYIVAGEGGQQTKETMLSVFMGRGYWELDSVDWISRCYLWSERTREWLIETGIFKEQQLLVVGNPRLDLYRDSKLAQDLSKKAGPFRLGVAFSAKSTSTYYGHPRFAKTYHDMHREMTFPITQPGRHFEDLVWRDHAILRNMMRSLRYYLENSEGEIWLRPSPFESPNEYTFLETAYPGRIKILQNQTLPEFLYGVDAVLTCWSTVGIEGLLLNKPIISIAGLIDQEHLFRHISPKAGGFETFAQFYHRPSTEAALLEMLQQASESQLAASSQPRAAVDQLLQELYAWPGRDSACELIAKDIARDIEVAQEHGASEWKQQLPLRYDIPLPLASLAAKLRMFLITLRSGEFNAYWDFLRTTDPAIEKLLRKMAPQTSIIAH